MATPLHQATAAAAETATVDGLNATSPTYLVKAEALDGNGDATSSGVTGTVTFTFISRAGDLPEPLSDDAGTQISIDLSAPVTFSVRAAGIKSITATPASIAGAAEYRVSVFEL